MKQGRFPSLAVGASGLGELGWFHTIGNQAIAQLKNHKSTMPQMLGESDEDSNLVHAVQELGRNPRLSSDLPGAIISLSEDP